MQIKQISFDATLDIRHRVLWPNKPKEHCILDGDESAAHYGVYLNEVLVGVASVYDSLGSVRLRKFAVEKKCQGMGLGSFMLKHIIDSVKSSGGVQFWCDARESAKAFYERFGLKVEGELFYKSNIAYYKMSVNF